MGGSTVLKVAAHDKRVKTVLTLDPYMGPINEEMESGEFQSLKDKNGIFILNNALFFGRKLNACKESGLQILDPKVAI